MIPTTTGTCTMINVDNPWYCQSSKQARLGAPIYNVLNGVAAAFLYVDFAYHIKSFIIGTWAQQFFPLAFVNQIMLTLLTELSLKCLKDTS